jgi:hypothetical protein
MLRLARLLVGVLLGTLLVPVPTHAQTPGYDQHAAWDPGFMAHSADAYRAGSGRPGEAYWQNRADYTIEVTLDTARQQVRGTVAIRYVNNSPDTLRYVWLQLDQNRFQGTSRSQETTAPRQPDRGTAGFQFSRVAVGPEGGTTAPDTLVTDTRMRVRLPTALPPDGGTVRLALDYRFTVPKNGRTAWERTASGPIFDVARWYPRMAVYDDVRGWNTLPFLGQGEFYTEFGTFDYRVTVPAGMIVAGSGTLQNPGEVLTDTQRARLDEARQSEETVAIIEADEVGNPGTRPQNEGTLTWHYRMEKTRDVAWAASPGFVWDAATATLPTGDSVLAMSYYPPSSIGGGETDGWERSTEFTKATVEIFSDYLTPYPWDTVVNVGGPVGGMEYPGLAFCSRRVTDYTLFFLTVHEHGHQWFPMIVGSDERRHAWMDEGLDTFINVLAHRRFNDGEFAPKRDGEYAPDGGNPAREIVPTMTDPDVEPIMTPADVLKPKWRHPIHYYKPALGLELLREYILGPERFDSAFRAYAQRWAFKHPKPHDFFRTIEDVAGEDLRWFWKGWFANSWQVDQAVTDVAYVDGTPAKGALITIENRRQLPMPVELRVVEADGTEGRTRLPVEVWQRGGTWTVRYDSEARVDSVIVDPDRQLPDVSLENNVWVRSPE